MARKRHTSKGTTRHPDDLKASLAGLDFETAVRAAMATGKPPRVAKRKKKRKGKK